MFASFSVSKVTVIRHIKIITLFTFAVNMVNPNSLMKKKNKRKQTNKETNKHKNKQTNIKNASPICLN